MVEEKEEEEEEVVGFILAAGTAREGVAAVVVLRDPRVHMV